MDPQLELKTTSWLGLTPPTWFFLLLALFFVGQSVKYSIKVSEKRSAIQRWQPQILGLDQGEDLAEKYQYPNPPIMALLLYPLAKLPPVAMALTWYYLKVGMIILCFHWVFSLLGEGGLLFPFWAKVLAVLLSLRALTGDLQHGNVNIFILFLVTGGVYLFARRKEAQGGLLIGLAVACKVTPALFIPYFVWKRSWKALAGVAAGLVLFLWPGVVPGLVLGFEENQKQVASWYKEMVHPFIVEGKVWSEHNNQSLPGLAYRLLGNNPSFSDYVEGQYTPTEYHNVANWGSGSLRWLLKAGMCCVALLVVLFCVFPKSGPFQGALTAEFAIVVLGMLLFSERTWKHHCVTLVLPFSVFAYSLAGGLGGAPGKWISLGCLATSTFLMSLTSTGLLNDHFAKMAQVYGCYTWAFVIQLAGLFGILWLEKKKGQATKTQPDLLVQAA
ncbi:MAG: DUF2029 domain-containing protein [Gemmataceae bacterium]|nr:DUF2029 domain-containing protein [Gemmataceae bacterium]